jgi:hypothetical protein
MTGWVLHGPMTIAHSDGFTVKIKNWDGGWADTNPDLAELYLKDGTPAQIDENGYPVGHGSDGGFPPFTGTHLYIPQVGTVGGAVEGNNITITITWSNMNPKVASANIYTGSIDNNGVASGSSVNTQNHIKDPWHIVEHFVIGS